MFETVECLAEDAASCAAELVDSVVERRRAGARLFARVACWADVNPAPLRYSNDREVTDEPRYDAWHPDCDGVPDVGANAVLELGALLGTSPRSAELLLRDVLAVRHRLPRHWHAVMTGQVDEWKARQVAKETSRLTEAQANWVDAEVLEATIALPWGRALTVVHGKVVAADPAGHEAELAEEEQKRFVSTRRRSNKYGLRTLVARGDAGDIARIEAMVAHLADLLEAAGDTDPVDTRRAKALALMANPALACVLLSRMSTRRPEATDNSDAPAEPRSALELARAFGRVLEELGSIALERLRPKSVLYLHLSEAAVSGGVGTQVARVEDPIAGGPIGIGQLRQWLRNDRVVVRPVLDPLAARSTDAYEAKGTLREAQLQLTPFEIFPWGTQPAREADLDHTEEYVPPDAGGPPGQTAIGNLGPLGRRRHNGKTSKAFQVHQPAPGLYYWRTPTGWWFQVDHRGTRPLGRDGPPLLSSPVGRMKPRELSPLENAFRNQLVTHLAS